MANILQGTDVPMGTIKVKDDSGNFIPLASMNDYNIYVYSIKNGIKTNIVTFKKTPVGTDKPIIIVDSETQGFIVDRTITKNIPPGDLYVESVIKMTATSDYVSSLRKSGVDGLLLCTIVQSSQPNSMA
jgi:hypothetical protein